MQEIQPGEWVLLLNDMRWSKFEQLGIVCHAADREELLELIRRERVDTYKDGKWSKSFRMGGPLEWYNIPAFNLTENIKQYEAPRGPMAPGAAELPNPNRTVWERLTRPSEF